VGPSIPEADWKLFRRLHPVALERFCQRVLDEVARLAGEPGPTAHQRYAAIYQLMQQKDKDLAGAFDNPRRSAALVQLATMCAHGLVTEEEMTGFSAQTRQAIARFAR
jgi:hypothetical protein